MRNALAVILVVISLITIAVSGSLTKSIENGRNQFRSTCKNCHSKGGVGGEITPLTKTSAQWKSYFEKGKHAKGTLVQVMPEQQLQEVRAFLVAHAADSEQPEICGR